MSWGGKQEIRTEALTEKYCAMCGEIKPISDFRKTRIETKLGFPVYSAYCKLCSNIYTSKKRQKYVDEGKCARCNKTREDGETYYCRECRIKTNAEIKERAHKRKQKAINYLGGKCEKCGLVTAALSVYEFHHLFDKEENLKTLIANGTWDIIEKELDKCILLCANCHRILHWEEENGSF